MRSGFSPDLEYRIGYVSRVSIVNTTATRVEMMRREIPGADGREAVMFLITLPPGAAAPVHAHPGIGVGYVLEGSYESQYEGETLQRFEAGDAIYDLAHTPHLIARNASDTLPLRFIMTFIVAKGDPTILPIQPPK
jgi:quercetin dioxygenase-like cupin family protein